MEIDDIIYSRQSDKENDKFSKSIEDHVTKISDYLKSKIK